MINPIYFLLFGTIVTATLGGATLATFHPGKFLQPVSSPTPTPVPPYSSISSLDVPSEIRPLNLLDIDEVEPGSEFDRFRREFRHAVANRDRQFLSQLLPENSPLEEQVEEVKLWEQLEKAIALGCIAKSNRQSNPSTPKIDPFTPLWICPPVQQEMIENYPPPSSLANSPQPRLDWEKNQVAIVGAGVNVRSQPDIDSEAIAVVSNEVLTLNPSISETSTDLWQRPLDGWTAILLPSQEAGYIYNRYVYSPLDPQLQFGQVQRQWQLFYFPQPPKP